MEVSSQAPRTAFVCLLSALLLCVAGSESVAQKTLASQEAIFKKAMEGIEGKHSSARAAAAVNYDKALDAALALAKQAGNLEALLGLKKEKNRFALEKNVPEEAPADLARAALAAQQAYREDLSRAADARSREVVQLAERYVTHLESMKVAYVKQEDIDNALKVKEAIEKVWLHPEVSAAKTALGAGAAGGKTADPKKEEPEAPEFEELKYTKMVDAGGGFSNHWQPTTMLLKKGDIVTLKATGAWKAARLSHACGPEGYGYTVPHAFAPGLPYGALVMRRGQRAQPEVVGAEFKFTNDSHGMTIAFDINESEDRKLRKSCSGSIKVEFLVKRPIPEKK